MSWIKGKIGWRSVKSLLINGGLFLLVFNLISLYQESHLLASDGSVLAPSLNLLTLEEARFDPLQLVGKTTVVYFFAPWCQVCHVSIGNLEQLYQAKGGVINVVAVALSYDSISEVAEFKQGQTLSFPILLGDDALMAQYQINGFPTYYVLDEAGRIVAKSQGYSTELGLRLRAI